MSAGKTYFLTKNRYFWPFFVQNYRLTSGKNNVLCIFWYPLVPHNTFKKHPLSDRSGTPQISGICRVLWVSGLGGSKTPNPTKKGVYFSENTVFISFKRGILIFHKKLQKVQNLQKKWYFIDTQETSQN